MTPFPALTRRRALARLGAFLAGSPLLSAQFVPRREHYRFPTLDEMANVLEFEPVAKAKITQNAYDFVAGAVEEEFSLRRNRQAFDWVHLVPRVTSAGGPVNLATEIFGQKLAAPLLVCPTAGHAQLHPEGEKETHRGATAAGTTMIVSNNSSFPFDQIAEAAPGPLWSQLYVHGDVDGAQERVLRAADSGAQAICVTVDAPWGSFRERLMENRNLNPAPAGTPAAASRRAQRARPRPGANNPYGIRPESNNQDWSFLGTLQSWAPKLPILVKGLLTAEDAKLALEYGAKGIVVSNHGARYLESVSATIEALPEIVEAVGGRLTILIDGGFRRGSDIAKALALGAHAVCVGRPPLWGLGAFGAEGVARVLEILKNELAQTMALLGCTSLADLTRDRVRADFP